MRPCDRAVGSADRHRHGWRVATFRGLLRISAESCRQNHVAVAASHGDKLPDEGQTETYPEERMQQGLGKVGGSTVDFRTTPP